MHEKSVSTLEFPKVLAQVAQEAGFSVARERVLALEPATDLAEADRRLAFTAEAVRLIDKQPWVSVGGARDIRPQLARAGRGGDLGPSELVEVASTLRAAQSVSHLLTDLDPEPFPQMSGLAERLPLHPQLLATIERTVNDEAEVLDSASLRLRRIRADQRSAEQQLQQRIRTLVAEFGDALQEPIVTMRGDRYVVPVRTDARSRVRGIVHDQSASGATIYIEPMAVVELNNRVRELQAQERAEIERILHEVSGEIGNVAPEIDAAVDALAELDLQLAKARHARLHRASRPGLNAEGKIVLEHARHPLLTGPVVPIDFQLTPEVFMVVVTGPNTGGKTVALKTVGLLTLMAQSGLLIPAEDGSEIAVMEEVLADIGDEQSIEQSLSTFSSHMTRIIEILSRVEAIRRRQGGQQPPRVLVLFDELGAGTDPDEGSALARSILTWLLDRHTPTVATTHYSELKAFAHGQKGVVNASVAFDVETLSPTYHLEIGVPGRSNALAIAERLGLDPRIVRGARRHLGSAGVEMEGLLEDLQQERAAAEDERRQVAEERREAERQREDLEEERFRLESDRARILDEARAQARDELESVLSELTRIRTSARSERPSRDRVGELHRQARRLEDRVAPVRAQRRPRPTPEAEKLDGPLQVGDRVRVLRLDQTGELISLAADGNDAEVQIGPMRMRVPLRDLEKIRRPRAEPDPERSQPAISLPRRERATASIQLDIRGQRVEDGLEQLESYLDDAALAGMSWVRIVHGKGTGALRAAVREHLNRHPLVKSAETAPANEGGDGVTLVQLQS
jgi:DNA mismatch repair protein MutS2